MASPKPPGRLILPLLGVLRQLVPSQADDVIRATVDMLMNRAVSPGMHAFRIPCCSIPSTFGLDLRDQRFGMMEGCLPLCLAIHYCIFYVLSQFFVSGRPCPTHQNHPTLGDGPPDGRWTWSILCVLYTLYGKCRFYCISWMRLYKFWIITN